MDSVPFLHRLQSDREASLDHRSGRPYAYLVFPRMRRHNGADGLPAVEGALSATEVRREVRTLESLKRRLRRP